MNYWLVKSEPEAFSWDQFVQDGKAMWDGVRNYQARNHLKAMRTGDLVMFYHSVSEKAVRGVGQITREFYPDPTVNDERWVAVDLKPVYRLKNPVSLATIKQDERLSGTALIRQSRLSVMPLTPDEFNRMLELGEAVEL
ncbi:Predicted RNA-binding protein, contains PUA-like domain [Catalinimonas alkaloidigena]|uniref:Predicted RNA-binding protein, contains PUA-like domain n=1 Tax=Catalinimonas alkaloidigena TaxID=1075417 RepID=A0A1G9SUY4_9BACT|nr:EVE domain-containing protein [Catalinimonas alkaloidigena]SDM39154.1 Predicted RNA-binding protein, contains PUA-like domain [Catalinimonas alkaloidigena]